MDEQLAKLVQKIGVKDECERMRLVNPCSATVASIADGSDTVGGATSPKELPPERCPGGGEEPVGAPEGLWPGRAARSVPCSPSSLRANPVLPRPKSGDGAPLGENKWNSENGLDSVLLHLNPADRNNQEEEKNDSNSEFGLKKMTRGGTLVDEEGLIMPRKPQNPCLTSMDRQNLHRELLFNQKIGRNVLNKKSELQRAIEKHKETQSRKEMEQKRLESRTPLERVIEERAKRLETLEKNLIEEENPGPQVENKPEFLEIHARLRAKMEAK